MGIRKSFEASGLRSAKSPETSELQSVGCFKRYTVHVDKAVSSNLVGSSGDGLRLDSRSNPSRQDCLRFGAPKPGSVIAASGGDTKLLDIIGLSVAKSIDSDNGGSWTVWNPVSLQQNALNPGRH